MDCSPPGLSEDLMASGLRGGLRHLCGLFSDPCRTEETAPHLGKYVQLCAAYHRHTHQHLHRFGPPHMEEIGRHGLGVHRCVDCQSEPRGGAIKKEGMHIVHPFFFE